MYKKNTLNNIILGNKRKDPVYQAVLTDLALAGLIDIKVAEALLGYKIPDYLKLPAGFNEAITAIEAGEEETPEEVEAGEEDPVDETPATDGEEVANDETGN